MTDSELSHIVNRQRRRKEALDPKCSVIVLDDIDALIFEVGRLRLLVRTASEDLHHGRHRDAELALGRP